MTPVAADGETLGEVMFRGNIVMKGYLKNPSATEEAFAGGWFHSGDLGVLHPDGYIQLKDRSKDIIISGGENISSIEVEDVLYKHPAVAVCAVVGKARREVGRDARRLHRAERRRRRATAEEIIAWCRDRLAALQVPPPRGVRRGAQDQHGQDPEIRAARAGEGDLRVQIALDLQGYPAQDRGLRATAPDSRRGLHK